MLRNLFFDRLQLLIQYSNTVITVSTKISKKYIGKLIKHSQFLGKLSKKNNQFLMLQTYF